MREFIKRFPGDWAGQKCLQKNRNKCLCHFYASLCLPMSAHSKKTTKCPANSLGMAKIRHIQHHLQGVKGERSSQNGRANHKKGAKLWEVLQTNPGHTCFSSCLFEAVFSMSVAWGQSLAVVFAACCSLSKNFGDLGVADLLPIEPGIFVCHFDRFVMFQDVSRCWSYGYPMFSPLKPAMDFVQTPQVPLLGAGLWLRGLNCITAQADV